MPETLTATSGRGTHFYFKYPEETLRGKVGFRPGLDVRAQGSMVVGPPSIHRNGSVYAFVSDDVGVASAHPGLIALIVGKEPMEREPNEDRESIRVGERNDQLFKRGCGMRGRGLEEAEIGERLTEINERECEDPIPDSEVQAIAQSASKYAKGPVAQSREHENNPLYYMPVNVNDWLANRDVLFMTDAQRGRYISLLVEAWRGKGMLPNDQQKLHKLSRATCGFDEFVQELPAIMEPFEECSTDNRFLVHPSCQALWEKQNRTYEQRKTAARASVESRKRKIEVQTVAA
jgi:hypothetical protein